MYYLFLWMIILGGAALGKKRKKHPHQPHASGNNEKPSSDGGKGPPVVEAPIVEPCPKHNDPHAQEDCYRQRQITIGVVLNWITAIGAIAAIFYGAVAWNQWQDSKKNFISDERAWLRVKEIKGVRLPIPAAVDKGLKDFVPYSYVVENFGKGPAMNVRSQSTFTFGTEPQIPKPDFEGTKESASFQTLFPNLPLESYSPHPIVFFPHDTREGKIDTLWLAGQAHLYIYIFIEYDSDSD